MLDTIAQLEAEQVSDNFAFTVPTIEPIADTENYPLVFEPTDIGRPDWEE
jgi:hypothetical protein